MKHDEDRDYPLLYVSDGLSSHASRFENPGGRLGRLGDALSRTWIYLGGMFGVGGLL